MVLPSAIASNCNNQSDLSDGGKIVQSDLSVSDLSGKIVEIAPPSDEILTNENQEVKQDDELEVVKKEVEL